MRKFIIKLVDEKKDGYLLQLTPKAPETGIKRLFLGLTKDYVVQTTTIEDELGNRTTIALKEMDFNSELMDTLFEFSLPNGVKVVRP
ncbi:MAG: outer-membrane lipoprotein carrier protein LolA [Deltaproteobacteria bacterium]|nr:outer-membrane lipoprotein carrier protein LolA [Deltaproteobacteria bacterium]